MKVAVCYSGYLRILEKTFYNIKNSVLNNHDVDYFIHTWDNDSYLSEINFAKKILKPKIFLKETPKTFERNPYSFINCSLTEEKYLDQLEKSGEDKIFTPIPSEKNNFKFDKSAEVVKFKYYSSYPHDVLSQYYSIYKSIQLKKIYEQQNNFEYDCVIRIRSDFICDSIDIENFDLNQINLPNCPIHRGTDLTVNDHFAFSSSKNMDIYSECFLFIPTYYFIYKVDLVQELLLGKHLRVNELDINKINLLSLVSRDGVNKQLEKH
tara:strand:- start:7836 stop:8630 length:795 start_codon:yes stop_codon:yes gene_type:complete